jgi:hypothetical protein
MNPYRDSRIELRYIPGHGTSALQADPRRRPLMRILRGQYGRGFTSHSWTDLLTTIPSPLPKGTCSIISLGCPKNLVDSERMLGLLDLAG